MIKVGDTLRDIHGNLYGVKYINNAVIGLEHESEVYAGLLEYCSIDDVEIMIIEGIWEWIPATPKQPTCICPIAQYISLGCTCEANATKKIKLGWE